MVKDKYPGEEERAMRHGLPLPHLPLHQSVNHSTPRMHLTEVVRVPTENNFNFYS